MPRLTSLSQSAFIGLGIARGGPLKFTQVARLLPSPTTIFDTFGNSVSISGDTFVVGAPADTHGDANVSNGGAAHVYVLSGGTWQHQQKLLHSSPSANEFNGWRVAINGDTIALGVRQDFEAVGGTIGSVRIFTRSAGTWTEQVKINTSITENGARVDDVALSDTTLVVGYPQIDEDGTLNVGAVFVYTGSGASWTEQAILYASNRVRNTALGRAVDIDGDTIVAAAANSGVGGVYVFTRTDGVWSQQAALDPTGGASPGGNEPSIAISGDTVAYGQGNISSGTGKVWVFTRTDGVWSEQQVIANPTATTGDLFGRSVALSGDTLVVGSRGYDSDTLSDIGQVYVYTRSGSTWELTDQFGAPEGDVVASYQFGEAVDIDRESNELIVTTSGTSSSQTPSRVRSAYVYNP